MRSPDYCKLNNFLAKCKISKTSLCIMFVGILVPYVQTLYKMKWCEFFNSIVLNFELSLKSLWQLGDLWLSKWCSIFKCQLFGQVCPNCRICTIFCCDKILLWLKSSNFDWLVFIILNVMACVSLTKALFNWKSLIWLFKNLFSKYVMHKNFYQAFLANLVCLIILMVYLPSAQESNVSPTLSVITLCLEYFRIKTHDFWV